MSVLDQDVKITIDGKEYVLRATTLALINVENDLNESLFVVVQDEKKLMRVGTLYSLFRNFLVVGNPAVLFDQAVEEYGIIKLSEILAEALLKSKILAKDAGKNTEAAPEK